MHGKPLFDDPFEALLDAAVDGIIVIDHQGLIKVVNKAADRLFGYANGELEGVNISLLMPPKDQAQHDEYVEKYLTTGVRKMIGIGRETVGQKKDGTHFPMYLTVGQFGLGTDSHFVGIIRDLTAQRLSEQEIIQHEKEIQQLRERLVHVARVSTLGEMATGVAHEINQPLAAIATYAQACSRLIQAGLGDPAELLEPLGKISDQAERAAKVITGVRHFAKKSPIICSEQSCHDVIHEVVALADAYARDSGVVIELDLTETPRTVRVVADPIQTQQVLLNLINNAIESMLEANDSEQANDRNIVLVRSRRLETAVEVAVIDQGTGIDSVHEQQIFDTFFTTKATGLGIGLAICQSIVTSQGGEIYFSGNQGMGCTFAFTLPRVVEELE